MNDWADNILLYVQVHRRTVTFASGHREWDEIMVAGEKMSCRGHAEKYLRVVNR